MSSSKKSIPDWRQFEQLVARIEADAGPLGLTVTSPDHIRCRTTGRLREVDASVRTRVGSSNILITIECRKRSVKQDVTWIEQLSTKKNAIGAAHTIAVSSSGFSQEAEAMALHHGIDLRRLSEVSAAEISKLIKIDFVLFTHPRCAIAHVGIRLFKSLDWTVPDPESVDLALPPTTNPFSPIFRNTETGATWSLNDLWLQLQEATNPFADIEKGHAPVVKTACFPFPGNVTVMTPDGSKKIGDVLLSVALSFEVEQVDLESAKKVEYTSLDGSAIQRVEFASRKAAAEDWRLSLQVPRDTEDITQVRIRGNWPRPKHPDQKKH